MPQATGTFEFTSWEEKPFSEIQDGPKLTHAHTTNVFRGDIEGESTVDYVMYYGAGDALGAGRVNGFEQIVGRIGERSGSFVLYHDGTFDNEAVTIALSVVPGSGTGELAGLRGTGSLVAKHGTKQTPYTLEYDFA